MYLGFIVASVLLFIRLANSFNVLAIFPYHGKSHFTVYRIFLRELANRGHNVTVISHYPEHDPPKNYHDISIAGTFEDHKVDIDMFKNKYKSLLISGMYLTYTGTKTCEVMLKNDQVQELIKRKPKFDVTVLEQFNSDCGLGIAYKLGSPVVGLTSQVLLPFFMDRFGIPSNPSYICHSLLEGGTKPNFLQRLERVLVNFYFNTIYYWLSQRNNQNTLAKYFDDIPPLEDLAREIKFILVYHNFVLTGSKLFPSNVIEVGGYHVAKAQPLSGNLEKFVDEAEHGIIYISYGSIIGTVPSDKVEAILGAMKEFPQRFVWRWDNKSLITDKNKLYIDNWLPQVDILGHPKTLAFFSHAGMASTTEAIHFGVPVIAMPIFGDQPSNAASIEESGLGIQLHYRDLTKENLVAALKKILDPKFRVKAKELSSAWHDRPQSALDTAVFWTEYAARHPSLSFRTRAADVPFYQYCLLDVIAVFLIVIAAIFGAFRFCCKKSKYFNLSNQNRNNVATKSKRE